MCVVLVMMKVNVKTSLLFIFNKEDGWQVAYDEKCWLVCGDMMMVDHTVTYTMEAIAVNIKCSTELESWLCNL